MYRKVAAVWVSLLIIVSSIVILVEIADRVEASYILHDPIRINNNAEFTLMAGIEGWVGDGSLGNPYIIEGYDINGSGYGYCIYIGNITAHFEVKNSYLHKASGWGFDSYYPDSGITLYNVQNGTITNNNASSNKNYGIYLYSSSNITVANNTAWNNYYGIIFGMYSNSNIITNNNLTYNYLGFLLSSSSNNTITNNIASSNTNYGIALSSSYNNTIANITALNDNCGIFLSFSSNNTITNNNASSNREGGIDLSSSSSNTITNNNVSSNKYYGINLYSSSNSTVANNTALNNSYGIILYSSSRITITNNKMIENGIFIFGYQLSHWITHTIDTSNTVNNNPVYYRKDQISGTVPLGAGEVILANCTNVVVKNQNLNNGSVGIELGFSYNNTIESNNMSSNHGYGVYLYSSNNNTITNNTASSNKLYGIYLRDSSDNSIFHNNIINNTNQAYDNKNNGNQWDNGYPLGGNYWSDYIGIDNFKGPNQDIPDSDGIGDTPYIIDGDSQDKYPLMVPFTNRTFNNSSVLKQGWNLISIPFIQVNQSLPKVLEMIDGYYDAVQLYDITNSADPWKHNKLGKPFGNDLFELNETMSFWIHITNPGDTIFLYNGTKPIQNQYIQLHKGWNMVGYPSKISYNRSQGLNNLTFDTHVDAIQWYDAAAKSWHFMGPDDSFVPGRGYWVHSKVEVEWEVPI
jgi:parallel beta-helix repeat protein